MEDFDIDLVDELCSSFCASSSSQTCQGTPIRPVEQSFSVRSSKRSESTIHPLETSTNKKVCLNDVTNRSIVYHDDEMNSLDESALQMLVGFVFITNSEHK